MTFTDDMYLENHTSPCKHENNHNLTKQLHTITSQELVLVYTITHLKNMAYNSAHYPM